MLKLLMKSFLPIFRSHSLQLRVNKPLIIVNIIEFKTHFWGQNTYLFHDNGVHESLPVLLEIILDLITDVFSFLELLKILPQQVVILDRDKRT